MAHLILATNDAAAYRLRKADLANTVIGFRLGFASGPLPTEEQLAVGLEPRSAKHRVRGDHWLDEVDRKWLDGERDVGLFDLCETFDSIELWVDPKPNDQLVLIWLLNLLRPHRDVTSKLSLVQTDDMVANYRAESVAKWKLPVCKVAESHLVTASRAWNAYRAPTPEDCFDLLLQDTTILPRLRPALIALMEELPDSLTGLSASEMGMLEWIGDGCDEPCVALGAARRREVFNEQEAGELLDELAQCPVPAILGMGEGPFDTSAEARYHRHRKSRVALSKLGRAILEGEEDFSRHNPIRRWWGGTELTNDRLWRWDRETRSLVAS